MRVNAHPGGMSTAVFGAVRAEVRRPLRSTVPGGKFRCSTQPCTWPRTTCDTADLDPPRFVCGALTWYMV